MSSMKSLVSCVCLVLLSLSSTEGAKQAEIDVVKSKGKSFVEEFYRVLSIEPVLRDSFIPDVVQRHRNAGWFSSTINVDRELESRLDERVLERLLVTTVDLYHLKLLYDLSRPLGSPYSREISSVLSQTQFLSPLIENSQDLDIRHLQKRSDVDLYLQEASRACQLFRQHLPKQLFATRMYSENLERLNLSPAPKVEIRDPVPEFGLGEDQPVFVFTEAIFTLYLITDQEKQPKILTFGFGK